jgi:hypothetical protein
VRKSLLVAGSAVVLGLGLAILTVSANTSRAASGPPEGTASNPKRIDVISRATAINNFVDIGPTGPTPGDLYVFSDDVFFTRWLLFCVRFVHGQVSWQTPGALSPDLEDLL